MTVAAIGIGSNINPSENINKVREILSSEFEILKESKFVKTSPIGFKNQDDFINGALLLSVDYSYEELRSKLKTIEKNLGRVKSINKYGPRPIDLDIVIWDGEIIDDDFYKRDFLKNSILELLPELDF